MTTETNQASVFDEWIMRHAYNWAYEHRYDLDACEFFAMDMGRQIGEDPSLAELSYGTLWGCWVLENNRDEYTGLVLS